MIGKDAMTKRTLQRKGYTVKHAAVGWWVDGVCGYLVAGYFPSEAQAVKEAGKAIATAKASGERPVWLF